jgi:hypothetical protein
MEDYPDNDLDNNVNNDHHEDDGLSLDGASSVGSTDTAALAERIAAAKRMLKQSRPPPPAIPKATETNHHKPKATSNIFLDSSSSSDEDDLSRSFAARRAVKQVTRPTSIKPTFSTAVLDDISNTCEDERNNDTDEWSNKVDDNKSDDDDSVDTATLERRILERQRPHTSTTAGGDNTAAAPTRNELLPEEDEFVLPDDDGDSSSSSDNDIGNDKNSRQRCSVERGGYGSGLEDLTGNPTDESFQNAAATHHVPNQSKGARDSIIPPEVMAAYDTIRQGLRRPSPRSRSFAAKRTTASSTLQDEIEELSEDEGPIRRRTLGRKQQDGSSLREQRSSLPVPKSKGKLVQQTLRFSSGTKPPRIGNKQRNAPHLSPPASQKFHVAIDVDFSGKLSPPKRASVPSQSYSRHQQQQHLGASSIDQDQATVHASARAELPFQRPQVHHDYHGQNKVQPAFPQYRQAAASWTHQNQAARHPPIRGQQANMHVHAYNDGRQDQWTYQSYGQQGHQNETPPQMHRYSPTANFQSVYNDPPLHLGPGRQLDFSITAPAHNDAPMPPPPAPRGRGRRIRDASSRPKRKGAWGGNRKKGGRKVAKRQQAAAPTTSTFRGPPRDDRLSGVGGATLRF